MTIGYTPYKRAWNARNRAHIRAYNRLYERRRRFEAGLVKRPYKGPGGHLWTADQKLRMRLRLWARRYNPDTLRLLTP